MVQIKIFGRNVIKLREQRQERTAEVKKINFRYKKPQKHTEEESPNVKEDSLDKFQKQSLWQKLQRRSLELKIIGKETFE